MEDGCRLPTTARRRQQSDTEEDLPTSSGGGSSDIFRRSSGGGGCLGLPQVYQGQGHPGVGPSLPWGAFLRCRSTEVDGNLDLVESGCRQRPTTAGNLDLVEPDGRQLPRTASAEPMDKDVAHQPLDQRFSDGGQRQPITAGQLPLDKRFGGKDQQLPMTALHLWSMVKAHDSDSNCTPLDQRFTVTADHSSVSTALRSTSSVASVNHVQDGQPLVTAGQVPSTVTATTGQRQATSAVTGLQDYNGNQAPSSHGTRTVNVCRWTSEQPHYSSMETSAGVQLWITDKASTTVMDASTGGGDTFGGAQQSIGSTEPRLATLGWPLDFDEADRPASLNVDSFGQRSSSLAASASGGSSAGHPRTESPEDRKHVGDGSQMDCGNGQEDSVICSEHRRHRFSTSQDSVKITKCLMVS